MVRFRSSAAYRIAVAYAAINAWTILLLGLAVYFVTDAEFNKEPEQEIAGELSRLSALSGRSELLQELRWRQSTPSSNRFLYSLVDKDGAPVGNIELVARSTARSDKTFLLGARQQIHSARSGTLETTHGLSVVVTRNTLATDRLQRMFFETFAAACIAVLAMSAAVGLILGWYLRNRLSPINATADAVVGGDLKWRVPVRVPGDEFDRAGQAINLMLDRIAGLMENLRQVSSDIAHDLRKPLMRLLLQTDRLGRVEGAEQRVFELGDEMLMLFSGILRIAEVEGGGLERSFTRVDLSELLIDVAESFAPALADSEHTMGWTIAPEIAVMGNPELLAQLVSNLLDNARIHTPARTTITLGLVNEGGKAKIVVEDNGPGVAPEDAEKLLQRFFRAEASRTTPGNGLGLSLVAAVARAHGGTVAIEDACPGLRLVVSLPSVA